MPLFTSGLEGVFSETQSLTRYCFICAFIQVDLSYAAPAVTEGAKLRRSGGKHHYSLTEKSLRESVFD